MYFSWVTFKPLKILVACEYSGRVREAFAAKGHIAWSCDLLPTEIPGNHHQGDVFDILDRGWDVLIAHPPCTYLANSGVQHLHKVAQRWHQMLEGRDFFLRLLHTDIPKIAVENPVPHSYADLPPYSQIIQPYHFGEEAEKKTCLWLKGLPKLQPTKIVERGERYIMANGKSNGSKWYQLPPGKDRWKHRSTTFQSIANAMANQWPGEILQRGLFE